MNQHGTFEFETPYSADKGKEKSSVVRHKAQQQQRLAKQLLRHQMPEVLPHPSLWLCHGLLRTDLAAAMSMQFIEYIVARCPQLVNLTVRVDRLAVGQKGLSLDDKVLGKKKEQLIAPEGVVQLLVRHDDTLRILGGLEWLAIHAVTVPSEVTIQCFEWMGERAVVASSSSSPSSSLSGLLRRGDATHFREAHKHWPKMEQFALHSQRQDCTTPLWQGLQELRLGIEFLIGPANTLCILFSGRTE